MSRMRVVFLCIIIFRGCVARSEQPDDNGRVIVESIFGVAFNALLLAKSKGLDPEAQKQLVQNMFSHIAYCSQVMADSADRSFLHRKRPNEDWKQLLGTPEGKEALEDLMLMIQEIQLQVV